MNCRDFELIILGLDRGESPGVAAVEHAAYCPECRKQLDAIREVRARLGALYRHDAAMEAPARVEAALLKELAQGRQKVTARVVVRRWTTTPRFKFAVAAAIILVAIAAGIGLVRSNYMGLRAKVPVIADGGQKKGPEPRATDDGEKNRTSHEPGTGSDDAKGLTAPDNNKAAQQQIAGGGQVSRDREHERNRPSREIRRGVASASRADDFEIATDYFPIDFGSFMQPIDGGQIVRIKVPRSALRSYGLPVDPLRADEAVKADVVIGNDGMARAIRFVH
jgi:hypothetical protein